MDKQKEPQGEPPDISVDSCNPPSGSAACGDNQGVSDSHGSSVKRKSSATNETTVKKTKVTNEVASCSSSTETEDFSQRPNEKEPEPSEPSTFLPTDTEVLNWLILSFALQELRKVLLIHVETTVKPFHYSLVQKLGKTICPNIHKKLNDKHEFVEKCQTTGCCASAWAKMLAANLSCGKKVNLQNCTVEQWPENHWECALFFMNYGYKNCTSAKTDVIGLIQFINNHQPTQTCLAAGLGNIEQARLLRNQIFHEGYMNVSTNDMTDGIDNIIQILELPQFHNANFSTSERISKLEKLKVTCDLKALPCPSTSLVWIEYLENICRYIEQGFSTEKTFEKSIIKWKDTHKCLSRRVYLTDPESRPGIMSLLTNFGTVNLQTHSNEQIERAEIREDVKEVYRRNHRKIIPMSWFPKYVLDLEKIWVKIKLQHDKHNSSTKSNTLETADEFLPQDLMDKHYRILVHSSPGSGKSLLLKQIAHIWTEWPHQHSPLYSFPLLVLIQAKDIQGDNIMDAICNKYFSGKWTAQDLHKLYPNGKGLMILIDSFDEAINSANMKTHVQGIISRSCYIEASFLLASRPYFVAFSKFDLVYSNLSFPLPSQKKFIAHFFALMKVHCVEGAEANVLKRWTDSKLIQTLCKLPLHLLFVCTLGSTGDLDRFETKSELYLQLYRFIGKRACNRSDIGTEDVDKATPDVTAEDVKKTQRLLEEAAFVELTKYSSDEITFKVKEDMNDMNLFNTAPLMGFASQIKFTDTVTYEEQSKLTFSHRTFVEFLSAMYVVQASSDTGVAALKTVFTGGQSHLQIAQFIFGLACKVNHQVVFSAANAMEDLLNLRCENIEEICMDSMDIQSYNSFFRTITRYFSDVDAGEYAKKISADVLKRLYYMVTSDIDSKDFEKKKMLWKADQMPDRAGLSAWLQWLTHVPQQVKTMRLDFGRMTPAALDAMISSLTNMVSSLKKLTMSFPKVEKVDEDSLERILENVCKQSPQVKFTEDTWEIIKIGKPSHHTCLDMDLQKETKNVFSILDLLERYSHVETTALKLAPTLSPKYIRRVMSSPVVCRTLLKLTWGCKTREELTALGGDPADQWPLNRLTRLVLGGPEGDGEVCAKPIDDIMTPLLSRLQSLTHLELKNINLGSERSVRPLVTWMGATASLTHVELMRCELSTDPAALQYLMSCEAANPKLSVQLDEGYKTRKVLSALGRDPVDQRPLHRLTRLVLDGNGEVNFTPIDDILTPLWGRLFLTHLMLNRINLSASRLVTLMSTKVSLAHVELHMCKLCTDPAALHDLMSCEAASTKLSVLEEGGVTRAALTALGGDPAKQRLLHRLTRLVLDGNGEANVTPIDDILRPLLGRLESLTHLILKNINLGTERSVRPLVTWMGAAASLTHVVLYWCCVTPALLDSVGLMAALRERAASSLGQLQQLIITYGKSGSTQEWAAWKQAVTPWVGEVSIQYDSSLGLRLTEVGMR